MKPRERKMFGPTLRAVSLAAISSLAVFVARSSIAETQAPDGFINGQRISAGHDFTCAIRETGAVSCWGRNYSGNLGDGGTESRELPSMVWGIGEPVISLALGDRHACALTISGGVKCWGENRLGQLGDGTTNNSSTAVGVIGLSSGVLKITAGYNYTCAITISGSRCWGGNLFGQLGDGTNDTRLAPTPVLFLPQATDIAAGRGHTCAIAGAQQAVYCWGLNNRGQLGNGTVSGDTTPDEPVIGLESGASSISAGRDQSCALLSATGGVKCWGANEYGQLGDASTEDRLSAVQVASMESGVTAIAVGYYHACAVQFGAMYCWGFNNTGRLGTGGRLNSSVPASVIGLTQPVVQIAAGYGQTCAAHSPDSYSCWGNNLHGSVGNGGLGYSTTPQDVTGLSAGVTSVEVGNEHVCALDNGAVYCWGDNRNGQLGDGTHVIRETPETVWGLESEIASISVSHDHGCALTQSGIAKCWGKNDRGQLGDGTTIDSATPLDVVGLGGGLLQLETAYSHTCALTATHGVKCWGNNEYGQLGDGSMEARLTPVDVADLDTGVQSISVGGGESCAILESGGVKCWGIVRDELGAANIALQPIDVPAFGSAVTLLKTGGNDCVVNDGGALRCRGNNADGLLGNGTTEDSLATPVEVLGFGSGAISASIADYHMCGVKVDGSAYCWGYSYAGVLGNGDPREFANPFPSQVRGLDSGVLAISAGTVNSCAVLNTGEAKCWGENLYGQVGTGESGAILVPTRVLIDEEIFRSGFD